MPVLRFTRKAKPFPCTTQQLQLMPNGIVGRDLIDYVQEKNITLLSHYARHDMKHLLLGFDTTEEGEICMQSFMFGNGRLSFPVLITVAFGLFFTPEYWHKMKLSFEMGKQCKRIYKWDWMALLNQETQIVKSKIYQLKQ